MNIYKQLIEDVCQNARTSLEPAADWDALHTEIEKRYGVELPGAVVELYALTSGGFIGIGEYSSWAVFSPADILGASKELNVDFCSRRLLPLVAFMENDLICYNLASEEFVMFNVVDEARFSNKPSLGAYFG